MDNEQKEYLQQTYAYTHDLHYEELPEIKAIREEYKKTGICKHNWVRDNPFTNDSRDHDWHCSICGQKDFYKGDD